MASPGMAPAPVPSSPQAPANQPNLAKLAAQVQVRGRAAWFYWIAALSVINSAVVMFGGNFHFVVGLGLTSIVDSTSKDVGAAGAVLALVINGFIAGMFAMFGYFACKAQKWAFIAGMSLYAIDGALCLMGSDILSAGFHAYVLYRLYTGFAAADQAA